MEDKRFKAIGFDYGGVIFGEPGSIFEKNIAKILNVSVEKFREVYFRHNHLFNVNDVPMEERWEPILRDLNGEEKLNDVLALCSKDRAINHELLSLVDELRFHGYKVGLLSNNSLEGGKRIRQNGLDKHFDAVIISAEVGLMKPQKEIFLLLAEKLAVKPNELIFVDDTPRSLEGIEDIGITPLLFKTYEFLQKDLKNLKVL